MKKLKKFEDYDSNVTNWRNRAKESGIEDIEKIEPNEENFIKLMNVQKENGGVIRIPVEMKETAIKYGYTIKPRIDDEVINAIDNFSKVNFVICDEDEEPYIINQ